MWWGLRDPDMLYILIGLLLVCNFSFVNKFLGLIPTENLLHAVHQNLTISMTPKLPVIILTIHCPEIYISLQSNFNLIIILTILGYLYLLIVLKTPYLVQITCEQLLYLNAVGYTSEKYYYLKIFFETPPKMISNSFQSCMTIWLLSILRHLQNLYLFYKKVPKKCLNQTSVPI